MSKPNLLNLVLRKLKTEGSSEGSEQKAPSADDLEAAMDDFQNATSATERASAFRAALELAKS